MLVKQLQNVRDRARKFGHFGVRLEEAFKDLARSDIDKMLGIVNNLIRLTTNFILVLTFRLLLKMIGVGCGW